MGICEYAINSISCCSMKMPMRFRHQVEHFRWLSSAAAQQVGIIREVHVALDPALKSKDMSVSQLRSTGGRLLPSKEPADGHLQSWVFSRLSKLNLNLGITPSDCPMLGNAALVPHANIDRKYWKYQWRIAEKPAARKMTAKVGRKTAAENL